MAKYTKQEREEAKAKLRELCPPETTVYTVLRHVSSSGMSRVIDAFIVKDGEIVSIARYMARVLDWPFANDKYHGVKVSGWGMDMGFHLVYSVAGSLYGYENRAAYSLHHRWL